MRFLGLRPSNKEIADTMKLLDTNGKIDLYSYRQGLSCYNTENQTVDHSGQRALRVSRSMHAKDLLKPDRGPEWVASFESAKIHAR